MKMSPGSVVSAFRDSIGYIFEKKLIFFVNYILLP